MIDLRLAATDLHIIYFKLLNVGYVVIFLFSCVCIMLVYKSSNILSQKYQLYDNGLYNFQYNILLRM